jgi:predicted AAA+ superfamily ATPase
MYIPRDINSELITLTREYPIVTLLGPRQAGKTTLAKKALPDYAYSNLEDPETREFAEHDPKAYLKSFPGKTIFDEIQRVPKLLSYLQVEVDARPENGRFILTGSHQLSLREAVTQSLAGRTAILTLLPLSIHELQKAGISHPDFSHCCFTGFLPRVYEQSQRPGPAYGNYYQTYVERDVRQLITLKDHSLFEKMLKLIAGRVGQLMDYSALANDVGVDSKTIRHWISILEASFILFKLPPYVENYGKRVIKSPKYYFTEPGLLCFLLGIREAEQVQRDPLVGSIFENLVVIEALKTRFNAGEPADLYFFRDSKGNEVDLLSGSGRNLIAAEIKSASTFSQGQLKGLRRFKELSQTVKRGIVFYNGQNYDLSEGLFVRHFSEVHTMFAG